MDVANLFREFEVMVKCGNDIPKRDQIYGICKQMHKNQFI
jgi:hypothetical protein